MEYSQYEAADEAEDSFSGTKRRSDDISTDADPTAEISTDVLIKTPHFITKTYQMINDSDPKIVAWTEAGDKFVVKDQLRLAGECIPRYFSHCNFSSFTRQLNFYRFRKMFPAVKIGPGNEVGNANEKHLIFYHEKFHRDHPEWLPDIKRSTKTSRSSAEQEQIIEDLQSQVAHLENRVATLSSELHVKVATIASEFERKLADVRSLLEYGHPPPAALPTKLQRYSTEDFLRSLISMDGGSRGMDSNLASAASLPMVAAPPPTRPLNRLGTLTLDDINRIVTQLENEGIVNDVTAGSSIPGPTNPSNRIASLSAEDILMTIRQMEHAKAPDRDRDGIDGKRMGL